MDLDKNYASLKRRDSKNIMINGKNFFQSLSKRDFIIFLNEIFDIKINSSFTKFESIMVFIDGNLWKIYETFFNVE